LTFDILDKILGAERVLLWEAKNNISYFLIVDTLFTSFICKLPVKESLLIIINFFVIDRRLYCDYLMSFDLVSWKLVRT